MTSRDIDRFFKELAREWPHPTEVILIGGAAAVIGGSRRPTFDVDFEVDFGGRRSSEDAEVFALALRKAEDASGVQGQFTEDIGAWSPIALPPWRGSARPWKRYGPISVKLLDTAIYVVSKLRRGDADDFSDLVLVARQGGAKWRRIAFLCGRAVRLSPSSTALRGFIRRVEYFYNIRGREVWGAGFRPEPAIALFRIVSAKKLKQTKPR